MMIFMLSCTKDANKNTANNILSSDRYVLAEVNGDTLLIQDGVAGFVNKVGTGGGVIDTNGTELWRQFTEYGNGTDTLRIYFIELFSSTPSATQKEEIVRVGNYDYGSGTGSVIPQGVAENGVVISYKNNNTWWTTEGHEQYNKSFVVDSLLTNSGNTSKYIVSGTFSCNMFNSNGDSISVNNTSFRALIIPE